MQQPASRVTLIAAVVTVAGGGAAILAAVLPWVKVALGSVLAGLSRSYAGTSTTHGKIVLALGSVMVLAGVIIAIAPRKDLLLAVAVVAVLAGLAATGLATYDASRKSELDRTFVRGFRQGFEQSTGQRVTEAQVRQLMSRLGIKILLGPGLYLAIAGGLIGAVGGVVGLYGGGQRTPLQPEQVGSEAEGPPPEPPLSS